MPVGNLVYAYSEKSHTMTHMKIEMNSWMVLRQDNWHVFRKEAMCYRISILWHLEDLHFWALLKFFI
jgi:hypothetical protein